MQHAFQYKGRTCLLGCIADDCNSNARKKCKGNFSVFIEKKSEQQPSSSSVTTTAELPVWALVGGTRGDERSLKPYFITSIKYYDILFVYFDHIDSIKQ